MSTEQVTMRATEIYKTAVCPVQTFLLGLRKDVYFKFIFSSPEPKAISQCPTSVVRCVSSTIASNDISSKTARPRTLIFGM